MQTFRKCVLLLALLIPAGLATCTEDALAGPCDPPANEIVCENSKPGNPPGEWDVQGAGDPSIQGFATSMSVDRGETIRFKIDTPSTAYRLDIYRMGYYGGDGARKVATVKPSAPLPQNQPPCEEEESTGLVDCGNWAESASWAVPANAVSGIYFAKLVREDQSSEGSHIMFVVRDDGGGSDLLFQTSDTTWEAYNRYGGNSLYTGGPGKNPDRAYKVSYNRPLTVRGTTPEDSPFNAEYPMVRWLERNGYDVSYTSEGDVDRDAGSLLEHKAFLSVGHDEYWSAAQRANVTAARDAGVNLAFFSGNEIFWKARWENGHRTLVCYKETHANEKIDPEANVWTGTWRDPRFGSQDGKEPENALSGTIFMVDEGTTAIEVPAADGKLRLWRNTNIASLEPGETATLAEGTLGYEWDEDLDNGFRPKGLFRLSSTTTKVPEKLEDYGSTYGPGTATHHLTEYRAPGGALVFSAGTVQWSWGLEGEHDREESTPDQRMRQATVNLLADMGSQPQTLQPGLVAASKSTDTSPPSSAIVSPTAGSKVEIGSSVSITGTATDATSETEKGGQVAGVEVSVDGGTTWHPAQGRGSWSYTWKPGGLGPATIKARAVDDSGNIQPTAAQETVEVGPRACPCSIWEGNLTAEAAADSNSVELGLKFRSDTAGFITGVRFFKAPENTGLHSGRLWTGTGNLLGQVTFTEESESGWQEADFENPIAIQAGTTYVVSYHAASGHYAAIKNFFTASGTDNPPLHALADGVDGGNGVFNYGPAGGLFSEGGPQSFEAANYLVDPVFIEELAEDKTPPVITSRIPIAGAIEVDPESPVSARFSEPIKSGSVSSSTVELRDSSNALVEATVTYKPANRRILLTPSDPLKYSSQYTMRIKGGAGGITDLAGNPMSADASWTFTTAAAPPPPPDEGPGGPILVITNTENQFGRYYPEILRAEGLDEFIATDISKVTPAVLNAHEVVILAQGALSSSQSQMLNEWVQQGGNLIAMKPDAKLLGLLGLSPAGGVLSNAYIGVDTSKAPGKGIVGETIQYHGNATRYTTAGAETIASLYSDASTKTANPAVTLRQVGSNGGSAAAFSYDLARSVVYTRQGNPAWAGEERDGIGPIRSDDLFFGAKEGDPQPDWVDPNKIAIPQADEQQRLLTNLIGQTNLDQKPLPRFWFLPRDEKAAVVMTGDDHGNGGTVGRFEQLEELSPPGCSVANWECLRATSYIYPNTPIPDPTAAKFTGEGFEIGLHFTTNCEDWTSISQLETIYSEQLAEWHANFPSLSTPSTSRTHCIPWSDWASQPKVELKNGIRLDTNYYYWPSEWVQDKPGMFTGSGMPMRFADRNGSPINVYQATTQMTDESGQSYPATIDSLLDNALGPKGYYGVFTANMHTDDPVSADGEAIVDAALEKGVPVVSAKQMLTWLDGRNQSSFSSISWAGGKLQFNIAPGAGATGLRAMVPKLSAGGELESVKQGTTTVPLIMQTIKGVDYAFFDATAGSYTATYSITTPPPPSLTATIPASPANDNSPEVTGTTPAGTTVKIYTGSSCAGAPVATGTAGQLATGITVSVGDNSTSTFTATATSSEAASNCSGPITYVEDSAAPQTTITQNPGPVAASGSAEFKFSGTDAGGSGVASFQCRIDSTEAAAWAACSSPKSYSGLTDGVHKFEVRAIDQAGNTDATPASFTWTVDTTAPQTTITQNPAALVASGSAEFKFSGTDTGGSGVASFQCRIDSTEAAAWAACSSPESYSALTDGVHKYEVRAIDQAGNTDATPASFTWTVDTTAPQTTITQSPAPLVATGAAEFRFGGDDGTGSGLASFQCRIDSSQAADWGSCTSPKSYSSLADGSHKFEVRAIDQAGNVDATPASFTWTVDTTAPQTSIDSSPAALTNSAAASFAFSGTDTGGSGVVSFQCRIDSSEAAAWGSCSSPKSLSGLADGSHKFEVRAIDQAGNIDATPASFTWAVDTTPPLVSIDSGPSGLTNDATPTFTFSSEPGLAFECSIDTGTPIFGPCSGNGTDTPSSPLADGPYTFRVRTIDEAGNPGQATQGFTVDTTVPDAPELTATVPASPANDNSPKIVGSAPDGSTVQLYVTNDCSGDPIATADPAELQSGVTVSVPNDSLTPFRATTTSSLGTLSACSSPLTYVEDSTAPETRIDAGPPGQSGSSSASFDFSGTDTGGSGVASFQCRLDSTNAADWESCTSPESYSSLADGSHSLEVRAIDQAGNVDATSASFTWAVDTTPPVVSIDSGPSGLTNDATPTFAFSSEPGLAFECSIDTGTPIFGPCSGNGTDTPSSPLADGTYTFRVRTVDAAGNPGGATRSFSVDATAPDAPSLTNLVPASPANDNSPKIVGSAQSGTTVRLYADANCSGTPLQVFSAASLAAGLTVSVADNSTSSFSASATSAAEVTSSCSNALTYVEDSIPPDTSITDHPPSQSSSNAAKFSFTGSDDSGSGVAAFECRLDSGAWTECDSPLEYSGLTDGTHGFEARARDAADNADTTPARFEWKIDTTPSTVPNQQVPPGSPGPTPSGAAQFIRVVRNTKAGTAFLIFTVSGPGRFSTHAAPLREVAPGGPQKGGAKSAARLKQIRLRQRGIKPTSTGVTGPGEVRVPIKLTGIGKSLLQRDHSLRVRVNVSFTALDGSKTTWKLNLELKKRAKSSKNSSK